MWLGRKMKEIKECSIPSPDVARAITIKEETCVVKRDKKRITEDVCRFLNETIEHNTSYSANFYIYGKNYWDEEWHCTGYHNKAIDFCIKELKNLGYRVTTIGSFINISWEESK